MISQSASFDHQATRSIWSDTSAPPSFEPLQESRRVDVAIVGAGITGLTAAALLKRAGKRVAVLEAQKFGEHGTTHRTSAHLTAVLDESFPMLVRRFGRQPVANAVAASTAAIDLVGQLSRELEIDCDFRRVDGFRYAEEGQDEREIEEDADGARAASLEVELTTSVPLPFAVARAYRVPNQAQFHPLKYISGLARFVHGDGSVVCDRTRAIECEDGPPCRIAIRADNNEGNGTTLTADHLILATHTPIGVWLTLQPRLVPYTSYCLAAKLAQPLPVPGLFWDVADPYHYTRCFDPEVGEVAIIGGADHKTGHGDPRHGFDDLERYARQRFNIESITHRWSAEFFEPADGLPYIGLAPGRTRTYIATGFSGTGLTFGTASAIMLRDLILGRPNPWVDSFNPARLKPLASAGRTLEEAASTIKGLVVDRFFKIADRDLEAIEPGHGKVMSIDGQRLAVYRDTRGGVHAMSASCTHMGCLVRWNDVERTWDCPCHGSLFSATGEPLCGPATKPLEPRAIEKPAATT